MHLMGVRLMTDWNLADLDCQRYLLFLSSHHLPHQFVQCGSQEYPRRPQAIPREHLEPTYGDECLPQDKVLLCISYLYYIVSFENVKW